MVFWAEPSWMLPSMSIHGLPNLIVVELCSRGQLNIN
jgi:hypothetical protein